MQEKKRKSRKPPEAPADPAKQQFDDIRKKDETLTLSIVYDPANDSVAISGSLNQRGKCYMMLKMAEKLVDDFYEKTKPPAGVPS